MKRILLITLSLLAFFAAFAQADTLTLAQLQAILKNDPEKAGGNHYNYTFSEYNPAPAPKGYKPIYISHYGRHGARYITTFSKYDLIWNLLENGHKKGVLTPAGEDFYRRYSDLYPMLRGHNGDLTATGQYQHRQLARRMVDAYPSVFGRKVKVDARATIVPRAIVSMMSFCDELRILRPWMDISYAADNSDLYFTALASSPDQNEATKSWQKIYANPELGKAYSAYYAGQSLDPKDFFQRYFNDISAVEEFGTPTELLSVIGEIAYNLQCLETQERMDDLFTEDERFLVWESSNLWAALMFTDNPYTNGLISAKAHTLLEDIIYKADSDLVSGDCQVRLRFGHDTVVAPLMVLLGVEGWKPLPGEMDRWKYHFQSWNIPMASNFQLVFYRGKKEDILVRAMYNEKDLVLPLEDQSLSPYYKWEDFKAYYIGVCEDAARSLADFN